MTVPSRVVRDGYLTSASPGQRLEHRRSRGRSPILPRSAYTVTSLMLLMIQGKWREKFKYISCILNFPAICFIHAMNHFCQMNTNPKSVNSYFSVEQREIACLSLCSIAWMIASRYLSISEGITKNQASTKSGILIHFFPHSQPRSTHFFLPRQ